MSTDSRSTDRRDDSRQETLLDRTCRLLESLEGVKQLTGVAGPLVSWFRRFELAARDATDPESRAEKLRSHAATVREFEEAFLVAYSDFRHIYWVSRFFRSTSLTKSF